MSLGIIQRPVIVRYFKQIWTNCWDLNYFRCRVTFVNVQLMRGSVIIRQLLIFDNVLFVRIILPFASPLSTLTPPRLIIRIINSQRNLMQASDSDQRMFRDVFDFRKMPAVLRDILHQVSPWDGIKCSPTTSRYCIFLSSQCFDVGYYSQHKDFHQQ